MMQVAEILRVHDLATPHAAVVGERAFSSAVDCLTTRVVPDRLLVLTPEGPDGHPATRASEVIIPLGAGNVAEALNRLVVFLRPHTRSVDESQQLQLTIERLMARWGRSSLAGRFVRCEFPAASFHTVFEALRLRLNTVEGLPLPPALFEVCIDGENTFISLPQLTENADVTGVVLVFVENGIKDNPQDNPSFGRGVPLSPVLDEHWVDAFVRLKVAELRKEERFARAQDEALEELARDYVPDAAWFIGWQWAVHDKVAAAEQLSSETVVAALEADGLTHLASVLKKSVSGVASWTPWKRAVEYLVVDTANDVRLRILMSVIHEAICRDDCLSERKIVVVPQSLWNNEAIRPGIERIARLGRKHNLGVVFGLREVDETALGFCGGVIYLDDIARQNAFLQGGYFWSHFLGVLFTQANPSLESEAWHIPVSLAVWTYDQAMDLMRLCTAKAETKSIRLHFDCYGGDNDEWARAGINLDNVSWTKEAPDLDYAQVWRDLLRLPSEDGGYAVIDDRDGIHSVEPWTNSSTFLQTVH